MRRSGEGKAAGVSVVGRNRSRVGDGDDLGVEHEGGGLRVAAEEDDEGEEDEEREDRGVERREDEQEELEHGLEEVHEDVLEDGGGH